MASSSSSPLCVLQSDKRDAWTLPGRTRLIEKLIFLFFSTKLFFSFFHIFQYFLRMVVSAWNRYCVVVFLVTALRTGTSQVSEARPKANSIKPGQVEEIPTPATNRSATVTKKHNIQVTSVISLSEKISAEMSEHFLPCITKKTVYEMQQKQS